MNFQDNDDEAELFKIEELSQTLEGYYKDMELTRRENLLFESYLARNKKKFQDMEEEVDEKQKKKKKDKGQERKELTAEEKYEIANFESEALKKNIDDGRVKSDSILETLRAILEETDMAITEIRKDAFDFQREILIGGENSRTGKIEAERIIKYIDEKLRQKDAAIEKFRMKKQSLEQQIAKTESQIKKKEEMGDDLKFIDFHQLQIENKKYVKEIDEKNNKLLTQKVTTGKIVTKLTSEKKHLKEEESRMKELQKEIHEKQQNFGEIQKNIEKVKKELSEETQKHRKLKQQSENILKKQNESQSNVSEMTCLNYINLKKVEDKLLYEIKNIKRKIKIIQSDFDVAKKQLGY